MKSRKNVFFCILSLLWYCLIFYFSAQPAVVSGGQSGHTIHALLTLLCPTYPAGNEVVQTAVRELLTFYIRKAAHMSLYLVLCLLIFRALQGLKHRRFFTPTICYFLAVLDEFHQTFVPGRSGELRDTLVDLTGALLGFLLLWLCSAAKRGYPRWLPVVLLSIGATALLLSLVFPDAIRYPFFAIRLNHGDSGALVPLSPEERTVVLSQVSPILHNFCLWVAGSFTAVSAVYGLFFVKKR